MKEIIVKIVRENAAKYLVDHAKVAATYWTENIATKDDFDGEKECLIVLILDSKLRVKAHSVISLGLLNQTLVHAREVFRAAIAYAGAQIILMHNHPSGDTSPSADDLRSTREIRMGGELLGIPLLDHVIVTSKGDAPCSIKEMGLLN